MLLAKHALCTLLAFIVTLSASRSITSSTISIASTSNSTTVSSTISPHLEQRFWRDKDNDTPEVNERPFDQDNAGQMVNKQPAKGILRPGSCTSWAREGKTWREHGSDWHRVKIGTDRSDMIDRNLRRDIVEKIVSMWRNTPRCQPTRHKYKDMKTSVDEETGDWTLEFPTPAGSFGHWLVRCQRSQFKTVWEDYTGCKNTD